MYIKKCSKRIHKQTRKQITIALILATFMITAIVCLIYLWTGFLSEPIPDIGRPLLFKYTKSIDFEELFSGEHEVTEVATKYSALYKDGKNRKMYVASVPVRDYATEGQYKILNRNIGEFLGEEDCYIIKNSDYSIYYKKIR